MEIKIDLNNPEFQNDLFNLEKVEQRALLNTLKKISKLRWPELYGYPGLRWELIQTAQGYGSERIYSFRFSQKYRVLALREREFLRLLSLHVDHDSAYD